jgi:hypothetical protein
MNNFKFIIYQFLLFSVALVTNVFFDKHIGPPLDFTDLISLIISIPIYIFVAFLIKKLYKRHNTVSLRNKIPLSILSLISSIIFLAVLERVWFEITGKMLF